MQNNPEKLRKLLKKELSKRIGILRWFPTYTQKDAFSDVIAGITLGLTIVPQSIAYASLARLPAQIGLFSACAGGFLYVLFGTIRQVSIGPTSLMSLLTLQYISNIPHEYMIEYLCLLTFLCGFIEFLMAILRLGFLVEIISSPVISGFTSASAVIIVLSQIKNILGISYKSDNVRDEIVNLFENCHQYKIGDTALGISCIIILLCLKLFRNFSAENKRLKKLFWFVSIGRNAIIVLLCCLLAYSIEFYGLKSPFVLTSKVPQGLPVIKPPPFKIINSNSTVTFFEMTKQLKSGFIIIPIVAVLINVSIAKTFATGGTIDATQEMLSLSICNMFASFLSSMPICGAFTRSAVSNASGVKTPFSNFYSALITILALTFMTPSFQYIPKATLAAVLIAAVIFLIDIKIVVPLWKSCRRDLIILISTFMVCLYFGVEIGLLIGVVGNLIHLIYLWARPSIYVEKCKKEFGEYIVITPDLGLFYPSNDHLYSFLMKTASDNQKNLPIAVNCGFFKGTDYTSLKNLSIISRDFKIRNQKLIFFNVNDTILKMYKNSRCGNLQICTNIEKIEDFLFDEIKELNRSITIPMIDTELKEIVSFIT